MPAFDPKVYEEAVVKPLQRWAGRELPDDLVSRYAIDLSMSDAQVVERLAEVRSQWNKGAHSTGKAASIKSLYKAFLRADEALRREHGDQLGRISWWREHERARAGTRQGQITELAQTLRDSFGELKLISPSKLEVTMRAAYAALAPDEVEQALTQAGITRSTPLELPKTSGLPDTTYRALRQQLIDAQAASVPELLFGPLTSLRVLTEFSCQPPQRLGLTSAAVRQAVDRENKRAVAASQASRAALGVLTTAVRDGADLRQLTLFHLLDNVRQHHAQGAPAGALVRQLCAAKLAEDEARMAVFSVRNESAPTPSAGGLDTVRELLADGLLIAAKQALATVADAKDAAIARELVDRQLAEVNRLRDAALTAWRTGDEDAAAGQLRQAAALATDDDDILGQLRRIPLPPVLEPLARSDGLGVRISWRAAPSHDETTRYRVVRRTGQAPIDPVDGETVREDTGTVATDTEAPAGEAIGYAVFAAAVDGPWSRPAGVVVEVWPPVHDVRLTVDKGVVNGHWQVHPDAASVEVRRDGPAGPVVRADSRTMFHDRTSATEQRYSFVAVYRRADGSEARSAPVSARAADGDRARPVSALQLAAVQSETGPRIAVRWRGSSDANVVVRRAARPCAWEFGALVSPGELSGYGEEVRGQLETEGEWRTLTAEAPTGVFHYVPFTMTPAGAVRGADNALGLALPVTRLRHQRFGPELLLSWVWPEKAGTAEIRWQTSQDSGRLRLTRQRYTIDGGCRIACGAGEVTVRVRSVVVADSGECFSPDAELVVPQRVPSVRYTVELTRRPLRPTTARIRLTSDEATPRCTVLVVAAPGVVMPRKADDGQLVLRSPAELRPGQEVELTAELPKLSRPYWVRCFLDSDSDSVRLVDPPTSQLKVR